MITIWTYALPPLLILGAVAWGYAASRHNVNIVDSLWSLFFLVASGVYIGFGGQWTPPSLGLLALVALWSLRLALHLSIRNQGKPEDRRYAAMRASNPRFNGQSLVTVFGLQAVLAWVISLPLVLLTALITLFAGLLPGLVAGSVIVEFIFSAEARSYFYTEYNALTFGPEIFGTISYHLWFVAFLFAYALITLPVFLWLNAPS